MSRQAIINQVTARLASLGVPFQVGQGADLTIYHEFVDAGWSTGDKRIVYEASVYVDEADCAVHMWEKTTETGSGFSGGFAGGSFTQSGTTLFRKVKSIQYGPDGKAYEFSLDLGAIPKAVKEATRQLGWKFKTVLSKSKAQYPAGYPGSPNPAASYPSYPAAASVVQPMSGAQPIQPAAPAAPAAGYCAGCGRPLSAGAQFCPGCGQPAGNGKIAVAAAPAAPVYTAPAAPVYAAAPAAASAGKPRNSFKTLTLIAYSLTGILLIALFALLKVNLTGWLIAVPVFALSAATQLTVVKKGCATGFVIWFVTTAFLLGVSLFTMK